MPLDNFEAEVQAGFPHLNIVDLLSAREQYHVFLTKHPNVVATAVGRYLTRKSGVWKGRGPKPPRTLANSYVDLEKAWPCVLVFVAEWQSEKELVMTKSPSAVVPKTLYLPDGRAVPVCIVEAQRVLVHAESGDRHNSFRYPKSIISGGYPVEVKVQGRSHFATVGCLVTDGGKYYGLTNRHVTGEAGRLVYAGVGNQLEPIGRAAPSGLQLSKVAFRDLYPGWPGTNLFVNADIGLIDIDDLRRWKTDVFQIGPIGQIVDLNVNSLSLNVIGRKVRSFGAGTGEISGQASALFYRYRSMGGMEYVSDFLIGPTSSDNPTVVRHGDSGAVLCFEDDGEVRPFAVTWGAHEFNYGADRETLGFALATGLGNVCRLLDVDIVRGWNVDVPYTWGKTGHFKIGHRAADLVGDRRLAKFLGANQDSLGYSSEALKGDEVVSGKFTHDFVPLADVADIIWRTTRPDDESNHFCDID